VRPSPMQLMNHREFPILYVDDEPQNLRIFEITFRRDFTVFTAESAAEGMRILNENPLAVVLSDQKMPEMTGTDFLARVREIDPQTVRILVTAYGDAEILGSAINDGSIYRYVPKPWEPDDLRMTLKRAIETYALDRERDALIGELTQLNQLSRELHRELELPRLGEVLVGAAQRDLGWDGAALLLFDETREKLEWRSLAPAGDAVSDDLRKLDITLETARNFIEDLCGGMTVTLKVDMLDELPRVLQAWIAEVAADEILVVPLMGKQGAIGALAVDNRSGGRRFGADDQTLLDGISTQAVVAIENAKIVDDLRNAKQQVQRVDRLGTLGTLAAGLAHEINNPLVSIATFMNLAPGKRSQDDEEFWDTYHSLACSELQRIQGLVTTMSRLAHGGAEQGNPAEVVIGDLAREVVTLLRGEIADSRVSVSLESAPDTPSVWGVRSHLQQVLLNLLYNAIHATPPEGEIRVYIERDSCSKDMVSLMITDSGEGIPEENLERIFDPFFTTKDPDKGTGLGLMISHRIVTDHGGSIEVRSRPGEGASFNVKLPLKPAEVTAHAPAAC
jgi:signal transduction histidine kinase/FixJ family two-component response regulator